MPVEIFEAYGHIDDIKTLFTEYTASLGIDLSYQNYSDEFASLPGKYAPPEGRLYIAYCGGTAAGCVGLRRFDEQTCEMKRLYVREAFRGLRIGKSLVERIILDAKASGYRAMLLDTLPSMETAQTLYRRLGFTDTAPYYDSPIEGTRFMRLPL
jgi:ribosomal protein S18 acetylase RimI-like enzyme